MGPGMTSIVQLKAYPMPCLASFLDVFGNLSFNFVVPPPRIPSFDLFKT